MNDIVKIITNNGEVYIGSIDRQTDTDIWLDEIRAFGDIVVLRLDDIQEIEEYETD